MIVQSLEKTGLAPEIRARRMRMPTGDTLVGIFGVLISVLITAGFLAFHTMWFLQAVCPPWQVGCPCPALAPAILLGEIQGLALLFLVLMDLAVGLTVALAFLASTRGDIAEGTRRSLFRFATMFLFAWSLVGTFFLPSLMASLIGGVRYLGHP